MVLLYFYAEKGGELWEETKNTRNERRARLIFVLDTRDKI